MTRYRWDGDRFVDRDGIPMPTEIRDFVPSPYVVRDVSYKSPLSGKEITSRSQRREEMKIHGVREVDPSERKAKDIFYHNKKYAEAAGRDWKPRAKPAADDGYQRLSRDDLPARLRKKLV